MITGFVLGLNVNPKRFFSIQQSLLKETGRIITLSLCSYEAK